MPEIPGRDEQILQSIIDGTEYSKHPKSRIEALLLELKELIEGGMGVSDYEALTNLPQINSVTLIGNKSLSDIGIVNPMVIKGRVDTVADLDNIQNPQPGWVYFVGSSGAAELAEYVYIENGNSGSWQFLGYNTIVIDSALSTTSENPVQNKVITNALDGKVNTVTGKGLSTNDYTNAEKASVALSAGTLTPISESAYEALTTKDKPLYFIYET